MVAAGTHRSTAPREQSTAAASRRQASQLFQAPPSSKSPSLTPTADRNPRKRDLSSTIRTERAQSLLEHSSSPSPTEDDEASPPKRLDDQKRDKMVNDYIKLQADEEALDRHIAQAEAERSDIARQISELEAGMEDATETKATLMENKERIKEEKKRL